MFNPADLARILAQPGYSLASQATETPRRASIGAKVDTDTAMTVLGRSTGLAWRSERDFQAACFSRFAELATVRAEYDMIYHFPNENSHRQPGVRGGIPDLIMFVPRQWTDEYGDTHYLAGLLIELKIRRNRPTPLQLDCMHRLTLAGYRCCVVWDSVDEVIQVIEEYLRLGDGRMNA